MGLSTFTLLFFFALNLPAQLRQLSGLSSEDLQILTQNVGLGNFQAYGQNLSPMGGYSGFYTFVHFRWLNLAPARQSSLLLSQQDDLQYLDVGFAKGLYYDIDLEFSFIPSLQTSDLAGYGGSIRWTWFKYTPTQTHALIAVSTRHTNLSSRAIFHTQSLDLLIHKDLTPFYSFVGIGFLSSTAQYMGGMEGITQSGQNETNTAQVIRPIMGGGYQWPQHHQLGFDLGFTGEVNFSLRYSYQWKD